MCWVFAHRSDATSSFESHCFNSHNRRCIFSFRYYREMYKRSATHEDLGRQQSDSVARRAEDDSPPWTSDDRLQSEGDWKRDDRSRQQSCRKRRQSDAVDERRERRPDVHKADHTERGEQGDERSKFTFLHNSRADAPAHFC